MIIGLMFIMAFHVAGKEAMSCYACGGQYEKCGTNLATMSKTSCNAGEVCQTFFDYKGSELRDLIRRCVKDIGTNCPDRCFHPPGAIAHDCLFCCRSDFCNSDNLLEILEKLEDKGDVASFATGSFFVILISFTMTRLLN